MKIGKAKYGGEFVPTKYWKLKDGESTYRILPPLGELADNGIWSVFYRIHYGYRNSFGKMRVFQSSLVMDRASKMVTVPDAAIERIDKLKAELERVKAQGTNRMAIEKFKNLLQQYNLDSNHYVNAMDLQGNIGVLKLRHRAKQALDAQIKRLNAAGVDPLSPEDGRFLTFTRSGTGLDTTFQVSVATEEFDVPNVGRVKRDLVHRLTPEIISRLGSEARELNKLFKKISSDEIARIVKESDLETGRSPAVDEILDAKGGGSDIDDGDDDSGGHASGGSSGGGTSTGGASFSGTTAGNQTVTLLASDSTYNMETTTSSVTPLQTEMVGTTQASSAPSPSAQTTAQKVSSMTEEDFQKYLSSLGI